MTQSQFMELRARPEPYSSPLVPEELLGVVEPKTHGRKSWEESEIKGRQ
jgi:hypothetical protein